MLFSKEYDVKYYEQNLKGDLKESALLNILQDIATLSAESLGFGPSFVFANNYAWVVLKYHIELYMPLTNLDSIILKTEPRGVSKLYAFRDFSIFTKKGTLLGKVVSTWALIDMETRRMLPTQKTLPMMLPFEKRLDDLEYRAIDKFEQPMYVKEFAVRFDDIDVNKHANNSNYIVWALESLPLEFRLSYNAKTIDIKFRKEISLGGSVVVESIKSDDEFCQTVHFIKDKENNEELASVLVNWRC